MPLSVSGVTVEFSFGEQMLSEIEENMRQTIQSGGYIPSDTVNGMINDQFSYLGSELSRDLFGDLSSRPEEKVLTSEHRNLFLERLHQRLLDRGVRYLSVPDGLAKDTVKPNTRVFGIYASDEKGIKKGLREWGTQIYPDVLNELKRVGIDLEILKLVLWPNGVYGRKF